MKAAISHPKVLIVDDLKANLVALTRLLAKVDAEVICADSGNEALALSLDHDFALILLDVQMPDIDGYEVAELLRGEDRTQDVPIIFVTANRKDDHHRLRGYGAGAVDYIEKPIDDVVLLSKVRVFIDLYRSHIQLQCEIDERKRREEESQLLAGTIFAASAEAILVSDADNNVITVNPAFTQVTGYLPAEVIGKNPRLLQSGLHDAGFFTALWVQLLAEGHWEGEIWNRRKGGEVYPEWLSISVVRNADGEVSRYVAIFSDITKRKRVEQELTESRLAAEAANRAKSRFLANMSHELRTPLNAILGFAELIELELQTTELPGRYGDYLRDIQSSGRHLLELVNDLLDMAKIEAGKWTLTPMPIATEPLVADCVRLLQGHARIGAISLSHALGPVPAEFVGDARALKQCLLNLLSNAVKFTPAGGEIRVMVEAVDGCMVFRVADTGIGIPAEDIPRLTQPFEQGKPAVYQTSQGTGLGLALVKSIVDLHGGTLTICSRYGEGTTVTMAVPITGKAN